MKTTISIPDQLFREAARFAKRNGLNRSELFTRAMREYLNRSCGDAILERINSASKNQDTKADKFFTALGGKALRKTKVEW